MALIRLPTTARLPTLAVRPEIEPFRVAVQLALRNADERTLLTSLVRTAPDRLRLTPAQAESLERGFAQAYDEWDREPAFQGVGSALADAVSRDAKRDGLYFLYVPREVTSTTRFFVFLHGAGGNFQFYMVALRRAFPDDVIVAPSYGLAWTRDGKPFLDDVLADVRRRVDGPLAKPLLIAISAGGAGAFSMYVAAPDEFAGMLGLVTCPDPRDVNSAPASVRATFVNAVNDDRFLIEPVRAIVLSREKELPAVRFAALDDADHFFLLTQPDRVTDVMRNEVAALLRERK